MSKTFIWLIIIIASFIFCFCTNRPKAKRKIYISEFGWTFQVPSQTQLKDSAFDKSGRITQKFEEDGSPETLTLFTLRDDSTNWFKGLAINDTKNFNRWEQYHDEDNSWYFSQLAQVPTIQILDTTYGVEYIDKVAFKKRAY